MTKLQDKKAFTQLFAGLMAQPERLKNKEYDLTLDDFVEKFHKVIFGAIKNLHLNGAIKISPIEIDSYLSGYTDQYRIFGDNTGRDYLLKIEELGEPENFDMHYHRIKKFSFLRECRKVGIDVSDIYDDNVVDLKEEKERNDKFNQMTLTDMVKHIELKMIDIREQFVSNSSLNGGHMSENAREFVASKKGTPNFGAPQASLYLNAIFRGSRLKKLHLKHGNTGGGKSRLGMGNMAVKTIPEIWDSKKNEWVKTGANGRGLLISTELDEEEIKMPFLAYIADVDESLIHEDKLTAAEEIRVDRAIDILEKSNLWFEVLSDFDIEDIEENIIKYINKHDVQFIEFDYIHMSLKLLTTLAEKGVKNLREDQVLLITGIALKNLCNEYNVHIESSTQLNDNQNLNDNMDQSWIRGSKALADKIDGGYIILEMRDKDKKVVDAVLASGNVNLFGIEPNVSLNVYKSRGNRYKRIRVFGYFDLGTLRFTDLFCLNYKNELVTEIQMKKLMMSDPNEVEIDEELFGEFEESPVEPDSLPDAFDNPTQSEGYAF